MDRPNAFMSSLMWRAIVYYEIFVYWHDIQFLTYCMDAYGCQLWNSSNNCNECYYCAWRKVWRHMWCLPYTTHNRLITIIFKTKYIETILELRCIKYIYCCTNSVNDTRIVTFTALNNRRSILGLNFRYLAFKYKIHRHTWYEELSVLLRHVNT